MAKRRHKKFYTYNCTITEEKFKVTKEAPNPGELMSVNAYYEMHPEEDDRPDHIKKSAVLYTPEEPEEEPENLEEQE